METLLVIALNEQSVSYKPIKIITDEYPDLYRLAVDSFTNSEIENVSDFYYLGTIKPAFMETEITSVYACVADSAALELEKDFSKVVPLITLWKSDNAYDAIVVTKIMNHIYRQEFPITDPVTND